MYYHSLLHLSFYFMYMCMNVCVFCLRICLYTVGGWYPLKPEEGIRFPEIGFIANCELPCGCWGIESGVSERVLFLQHSHPHPNLDKAVTLE